MISFDFAENGGGGYDLIRIDPTSVNQPREVVGNIGNLDLVQQIVALLNAAQQQ